VESAREVCFAAGRGFSAEVVCEAGLLSEHKDFLVKNWSKGGSHESGKQEDMSDMPGKESCPGNL
jgi:hypothetical protein